MAQAERAITWTQGIIMYTSTTYMMVHLVTELVDQGAQ